MTRANFFNVIAVAILGAAANRKPKYTIERDGRYFMAISRCTSPQIYYLGDSESAARDGIERAFKRHGWI